ncbi:hypothetical protein Hypma_014262 [Hypsizygus marmoreus]|uniref:F-box domain-containing protein n=1 Tax=Hypsizygus marmoreus TaxID=39966 RepID=A0A369JB88_HYPMA|nr:hypothetical protein Hypma_014262 [Hypsizygus marmoreus]
MSLANPQTGVSPINIHNIPLDVMYDVFLLCLSSGTSPVPSRRSAPLNLMWVCRSWRQFACDISRLWTTLKLSGGPNEVLNWEPMVRHWLQLAGDRPMSLSYDFTSDRAISSTPILTTSLLPFASRIRRLELRLESLQYLPLRQILPSGFLLLESISFTNLESFGDWRSPRVRSIIDLSKCRCLRHADIAWISARRRNINNFNNGRRMLLEFKLPWSQLTSLKIVDSLATPTEAVGILKQCTSLIECHVSLGLGALIPNDTPAHPMLPPAVLADLTSLTIEWKFLPFFLTTDGICPIIRALTLPVLTTLNLAAGGTPSSALCTALCDLQQRSDFPLLHFSLSGDSNPTGLRSFFVHTPSLRSLSFDLFEQKVYIELASMLADSCTNTNTHATIILPALTSLSLSLCAFGVLNGITGITAYQPLPLDEGALRNYREMYSLSGTIIPTLARARFWPAGEAESLAKFSHLVLRTWRSRESPGEYCGQEWVSDTGGIRNLVEKLESEGLTIEFPVDYID